MPYLRLSAACTVAATFSAREAEVLEQHAARAPIRRRCRCRPRRRSRTSTSRRSRPSRPRCAAGRRAARPSCRPRPGGRRWWCWASRPRARRSSWRPAAAAPSSASCTSEPVAMMHGLGLLLEADVGSARSARRRPADVAQVASWAHRAGSGATAAARSGALRFCSATAQATAVSAVSPGRQTSRFGIRRSAGGVLDRLVRRAVFAEADGVVREHVDHALLHQRGHADGVAAVVAEGQEGAAVGDVAAVQRHAVHDGGHAELAHAVVDVAADLAVGACSVRSPRHRPRRRRRSAAPACSWCW